MARWTKPSEAMPVIDAGDRILSIVVERSCRTASMRPRLVILEATEGGWSSPDPVYDGYTPEDAVLWTAEKDICQIASVLGLVDR